MKSIIKSQIYQMRLTYLWKKIFFLLLGFNMLMMYIDVVLDDSAGSLSVFMVEGDYSSLITFVLLFVVLTTAEICGNDFADKTINHDLLSGHTRKEVFFGRVIVAMGVSFIGAALLILVPLFIFYGAGYWGNTLDFSGALFRNLLCLLPIMKVCIEVIFLTCILKNGLFSAVLGSILIIVISMANGMGTITCPYLFSVTNIGQVLHFHGEGVMCAKDLKEFISYEVALEPDVLLSTCLYSTIIGAMVLVLAYKVFEKDDLR